jgi:hypothetical protein
VWYGRHIASIQAFTVILSLVLLVRSRFLVLGLAWPCFLLPVSFMWVLFLSRCQGEIRLSLRPHISLNYGVKECLASLQASMSFTLLFRNLSEFLKSRVFISNVNLTWQLVNLVHGSLLPISSEDLQRFPPTLDRDFSSK